MKNFFYNLTVINKRISNKDNNNNNTLFHDNKPLNKKKGNF